jgi:primosomal replication protein N
MGHPREVGEEERKRRFKPNSVEGHREGTVSASIRGGSSLPLRGFLLREREKPVQTVPTFFLSGGCPTVKGGWTP